MSEVNSHRVTGNNLTHTNIPRTRRNKNVPINPWLSVIKNQDAFSAMVKNDYGIIVRIQKCTDYLASVCDWCKSKDEQGYNCIDTDEGHKLSRKASIRFMSIEQVRMWALRLNLYRSQLTSHFGKQYPDYLFEGE